MASVRWRTQRPASKVLVQTEGTGPKQADESYRDQIDGDNEIQQLWHDQDEDAGQQGDQRRQAKV